MLIQRGADLNIKNNKNQTCFDLPASMKSKPRAKMEAFLKEVLEKNKKLPKPQPQPQQRGKYLALILNSNK